MSVELHLRKKRKRSRRVGVFCATFLGGALRIRAFHVGGTCTCATPAEVRKQKGRKPFFCGHIRDALRHTEQPAESGKSDPTLGRLWRMQIMSLRRRKNRTGSALVRVHGSYCFLLLAPFPVCL